MIWQDFVFSMKCPFRNGNFVLRWGVGPEGAIEWQAGCSSTVIHIAFPSVFLFVLVIPFVPVD